jgi:hypothetical protein
MQNLDDVSLHHVIEYLTIKDFCMSYLSSRYMNLKLQKYKRLKQPFFVLIKWVDWRESYRKLNRFDLKLDVFKKFRLLDRKNLWKNQDLVKFILRSNETPCDDLELVPIPYMFRDCFQASKKKISLAKYDKLLIQRAIKTNDTSQIIEQHQFLEFYLQKTDMYMNDLQVEVAWQL